MYLNLNRLKEKLSLITFSYHFRYKILFSIHPSCPTLEEHFVLCCSNLERVCSLNKWNIIPTSADCVISSLYWREKFFHYAYFYWIMELITIFLWKQNRRSTSLLNIFLINRRCENGSPPPVVAHYRKEIRFHLIF